MFRSSKYNTDRKTLERYRNMFCLEDAFWINYKKGSDVELLLTRFAETAIYSWEMHFKRLLPHIAFEFELSTNGMFDEDGVCITFSQVYLYP